jgi:hypothetical protein
MALAERGPSGREHQVWQSTVLGGSGTAATPGTETLKLGARGGKCGGGGAWGCVTVCGWMTIAR